MIRSGRTGARRWTEARGSISARGLVPFLDTLFNLLFALLAISAARASTSFDLLRLRLPLVERGPEQAGASAGIVIEVAEDGTLRPAGAEREMGSREELDRTLAAAVGDGVPEELALEIRAAALCPHGVVLELLQHLRTLGFSDIRLAAITGNGGGR